MRMALVTTGRPKIAAAEAVACDFCAGAFFVSFFFVVTRNKIFASRSSNLLPDGIPFRSTRGATLSNEGK